MFLYNTASRILFVNKLSVDLVFNIHSASNLARILHLRVLYK